MKEQILKANRSNAKYTVLVWVMEAKNSIFQIKDNTLWTSTEIKKEDLIEFIIKKIWINKLDFYCPAKDLIKN